MGTTIGAFQTYKNMKYDAEQQTIGDLNALIESIVQLGFKATDKPRHPCYEKSATQRGEPARILVSIKKDRVTMRVYLSDWPPFEFKFKKDYIEAEKFITDYIRECD